MLIRDLILPDGGIIEFHTGNVVHRSARPSDMPWNELSGSAPVVNRGAGQPFIGCQTGGDIIADRLMQNLIT